MTGKPHFRPQDLILPGEWADSGACRGEPTDVFFPAHANSGRRGTSNSIYRRARKVCMSCPVRAECLDHAVTAGEVYGMWGGLTPKERFALGRRPVGAVVLPACPDCGDATWVHSGQGVRCDACRVAARRRRAR